VPVRGLHIGQMARLQRSQMAIEHFLGGQICRSVPRDRYPSVYENPNDHQRGRCREHRAVYSPRRRGTVESRIDFRAQAVRRLKVERATVKRGSEALTIFNSAGARLARFKMFFNIETVDDIQLAIDIGVQKRPALLATHAAPPLCIRMLRTSEAGLAPERASTSLFPTEPI